MPVESLEFNDLSEIFSKSFATTSFLMDDKLSSADQFKEQLKKFLKTDKKEIIKSLLDSNLTGRGGAGFPTGMKWDFCSKAKGDKNMSYAMLMKETLVRFLIDIF